MTTPPPKPITRWYLALALAGLVGTWFFNLQYFQSGGSVAPGRFWADAMANPLTSAITMDVYLSALVFAVWVWRETARVSRWRSPASIRASAAGSTPASRRRKASTLSWF